MKSNIIIAFNSHHQVAYQVSLSKINWEWQYSIN